MGVRFPPGVPKIRENNMLTKFQEAVKYLQGTCTMSIQEGLEIILSREATEEELIDFTKYFDDQLFECECCGWIYEIGECNECNEGWLCDGCYEDLEE